MFKHKLRWKFFYLQCELFFAPRASAPIFCLRFYVNEVFSHLISLFLFASDRQAKPSVENEILLEFLSSSKALLHFFAPLTNLNLPSFVRLQKGDYTQRTISLFGLMAF